MFAEVVHFVLMFGSLGIGLDRCVCWMMFEHYVGWHNKTMGKKGTECFLFSRVWLYVLFGMNASLYCLWTENTRLWPWDACGQFDIFINGLCPLDCIVPVVWKTFLFLPSVNSFIMWWMRLFVMELCSNAFNLKASSYKILILRLAW